MIRKAGRILYGVWFCVWLLPAGVALLALLACTLMMRGPDAALDMLLNVLDDD